MKKVICLGMTKTGTTSLMKALRILGYNVANVYNERTKKNYDAFVGDQLCTIPVKKLIQDNPDAQFILTLRENPDRWFDSIYNFARQPNKIKDKQVLSIRKSIYGHYMPDVTNEMDFLHVYLKRIQDTIQFSDESKTLTLNIDNNSGWSTLCNFLKKDIPLVDFPHSNKTKYKKNGSN